MSKKIKTQNKEIKKPKKQLSSYLFYILFVINILFVFFIVKNLPFRFETNDDVLMALIASGGYTGTPESHLIFINIIYGFILSFLYSITTFVEWYTLLFLALNVLGATILANFILKRSINKFLKISFLILFYLIFFKITILLQFTTTAAIICLSGIILIFSKKKKKYLFGIFLFILGSLIRFEVAILTLLITSPLFLEELLELKKIKITKPLILASIVFVLVIAFNYVDNYLYNQNTEWKYYREYNLERGKINDNPNSVKIKKIPEGISTFDYNFLLHFFPDRNIMTLDKLEKINKSIEQVSSKKKIENILPNFNLQRNFLIPICILFLILIFYPIKYSKRIVLILSFIAFILALCYASLNGLLKDRVFISSLLIAFLVLIKILDNTKFRKILLIPPIIIVLTLSFFYFEKISDIKKITKLIRAEFFKQHSLIKEYLDDDDKTITVFGADYFQEGMPPLEISKFSMKNKMFSLGWLTAIPFNKGKFDSFKDLIDGHALIIKKAYGKQITQYIIQNIFDNYGIKVKGYIIKESETIFIIEFRKENK